MSTLHSISILEQQDQSVFTFYKDSKIIEIVSSIFGVIEPTIHDIKNDDSLEIDYKNNLSYISDEKKMFFTLTCGPHHFINDTVATILKFIEDFPNTKLYLDISNAKNQDQKIYDFFYKVLKNENINFEIVDFSNITYIKANNFYIVDNFDKFFNAPNYVYKYYSKNINNNAVPSRKVYLSRKLINNHQRIWNDPNNTLSIKDDIRIKNEYKLEEFLYNNGFDIVQPELFNSFEEQVSYFSDVKTIVSATSAGLVNSYFMKPGGNVVEFITPMLFLYGANNSTKLQNNYKVELHHFYKLASYYMDHNYLGIPNKNKTAENIIYTIENNDIIKNMLGIK